MPQVTVKANGSRYILSDMAVSILDEALTLMVKEGRESGGYWCATPGRSKLAPWLLEPASLCQGTVCSTGLGQAVCAPSDTVQPKGSFHTHPGGSLEMSVGDMLVALYHEMTGIGGAQCRAAITSSGTPQVRCDTVKQEGEGVSPQLQAAYREASVIYQDKIRPIYDHWSTTGEAPSRALMPEAYAAYDRAEALLKPLFDRGWSAALPIHGLMAERRCDELHQDLSRSTQRALGAKAASLCSLADRRTEMLREHRAEMQAELEGANERGGAMAAAGRTMCRLTIQDLDDQIKAIEKVGCTPFSNEALDAIQQYRLQQGRRLGLDIMEEAARGDCAAVQEQWGRFEANREVESEVDLERHLRDMPSVDATWDVFFTLRGEIQKLKHAYCEKWI